jgi:hypothetical protein
MVYLPGSGDAPGGVACTDLAVPKGRGQRVLVVDDEMSLVSFTTETLFEFGDGAVGFTSSTAAPVAFFGNPASFDAVMTDARMPKAPGSTLFKPRAVFAGSSRSRCSAAMWVV